MRARIRAVRQALHAQGCRAWLRRRPKCLSLKQLSLAHAVRGHSLPSEATADLSKRLGVLALALCSKPWEVRASDEVQIPANFLGVLLDSRRDMIGGSDQTHGADP